MINERLLTAAKERYELEFTRRSYLITTVGIYFAALNLLLLLMFNVYNRAPLSIDDVDHACLCVSLSIYSCTFTYISFTYLTFFVSVILFIFFISLTVITLFRAFVRQTYNYLPLPSDIQTYIQNLQEYYDENYEQFFKEVGLKNILIDQDFADNLLKEYIKNVEHNHHTNNFRSDRINEISRYLLISIIILIFNFLSFWLFRLINRL